MDKITNWTELLFSSLKTFGDSIMSVLPSIIGGIFILLFGWMMARLLSKGIRKLLTTVKFDDLANKVNTGEILEQAGLEMTASELIAKFVYWMIMLLVFITASETLGWTAVSDQISKLIGYLPTLFSAIIIFILGTFMASFVRDVIKGATASIGISAGSILSSVVFYMLLIVVAITSLEQAGVDTTMLSSNVLVIVTSVMLAAAISYGFASRELLSNILASFFTRSTFTKGQIIQIDDVKGEIIDANNISVRIKTENEEVIIPTHQLITNRVKIFKK